MGELCDGQYQKLLVESGTYFRKNFFGSDPRLLKMVEHLSDEQIEKLRLGGHDPIKVYAAYKAAVDHTGSPTVILAKTIKGYGLGESGEGRNIIHQQKKINDEELMIFRSRFGIPIPDEKLHDAPFYRPPDESTEIQYMAGEEIIYKRYFNIGVAVDTDRGLLVPVIRDVDKKNIIELAVELSAVSAKAREKKLTVEDMEGGSFTITNLGGVGGTAFTPIVNYPEVAILGISRSRVEPVWMNGKFEPRIMPTYQD